MKNLIYPPFHATGLVDAFAAGSAAPVITVQVSTYLTHQDELASAMTRDAKWKLSLLGVPKEELNLLYFEYNGTTHLVAVEPKGVRRVEGERVEAFFDYHGIPKRNVLIRQRRLVPFDAENARAIYGKKTPAAKTAEVPA